MGRNSIGDASPMVTIGDVFCMIGDAFCMIGDAFCMISPHQGRFENFVDMLTKFTPDGSIGPRADAIADYIGTIADYIDAIANYIGTITDYIGTISGYIRTIIDYIGDYIVTIANYMGSLSQLSWIHYPDGIRPKSIGSILAAVGDHNTSYVNVALHELGLD